MKHSEHLERQALAGSFQTGADVYDRARPDYPQAILDRLRPLPGDCRVLDVGCGSGLGTRLWLGEAAEIVALDPSAQMIETAARSLGAPTNVRFLLSSFEQSEFPEQYFHVVFAAQSFHWVDLNVGFRKARTTLKENGRLVLVWNYLDFESSSQLQAARDAILRRAPAFGRWPDSSRERFQAYREEWETAVRNSRAFQLVDVDVLSREIRVTSDWLSAWLATLSWFKALESTTRTTLKADVAKCTAEEDSMLVVIRTLLVIAAPLDGRTERTGQDA